MHQGVELVFDFLFGEWTEPLRPSWGTRPWSLIWPVHCSGCLCACPAMAGLPEVLMTDIDLVQQLEERTRLLPDRVVRRREPCMVNRSNC